jgi:hypothetical protein
MLHPVVLLSDSSWEAAGEFIWSSPRNLPDRRERQKSMPSQHSPINT